MFTLCERLIGTCSRKESKVRGTLQGRHQRIHAHNRLQVQSLHFKTLFVHVIAPANLAKNAHPSLVTIILVYSYITPIIPVVSI